MSDYFSFSTIRYLDFLRVLKVEFLNNQHYAKVWFEEFGDDLFDAIDLYQTKNGKTEELKPTVEYPEGEENYPVFHCGLPDGEYRVLDAYDEDGNAYYLSIVDGSYSDNNMALAGAYVSWCRQSKTPTGEITYANDDLESGRNYYYFGWRGERYDKHNHVRRSEFNVDEKTVLLLTMGMWC